MGVWRYSEVVPPPSGGHYWRIVAVRHIGVDLSKRAFTACFLEEDDTQCLATFSMTVEGLEAFRDHVNVEDRLALEAGLNSYFFCDQMEGAVAEIVVVNPHQFAVIATSKKKTDRSDAIALARFLKLDCLPVVAVPARNIRELRQLFAARDALVKMARQLKSVGHARWCVTASTAVEPISPPMLLASGWPAGRILALPTA